jgi:hypothetical protein
MNELKNNASMLKYRSNSGEKQEKKKGVEETWRPFVSNSDTFELLLWMFAKIQLRGTGATSSKDKQGQGAVDPRKTVAQSSQILLLELNAHEYWLNTPVMRNSRNVLYAAGTCSISDSALEARAADWGATTSEFAECKELRRIKRLTF